MHRKKIFLFNVTVQNHGPFDLEAPDLESRVKLSENYPMAEQYFNLLNYSDQAFSKLIHYFEDYNEPVAVLMFGDHQAKIEDAFYESLLGEPLNDLSLKGKMKRYVVPYYVWSNYGLKTDDWNNMSANYLGAQLIEWLGFPQTAEHKFLNSMKQEWPVITSEGVSPDDISFTEHAQDEWFQKYEQMSYNLLFDQKAKWKEIYLLEE